jgi:hypothetical protein
MAEADAVALAGGDVLTPCGLCTGVGDAVAVQALIANVNTGTNAIRMVALTGTALRSMAGSSLLAG